MCVCDSRDENVKGERTKILLLRWIDTYKERREKKGKREKREEIEERRRRRRREI